MFVLERDPLIKLFEQKPRILEWLGRAWELFYIEGRTPDVGKRRENFVKLLLKYELGLEVESAPNTERSWDFRVRIGGRWYTYSLKTSEEPTTIKVAWNGFPSWERAESFEFKYPILYIMHDRKARKINVYVFDPELINQVRCTMGRNFWWMPSGGNPRGFGVSRDAVKALMMEAERRGNRISVKYNPIKDLKQATEKYWREWYNIFKRLIENNEL